MPELRIVDVRDEAAFAAIRPCADPRFDHRTCDYWENAERGSNRARPDWLTAPRRRSRPSQPSDTDNPFAPPPNRTVDLAAALRDADPLPRRCWPRRPTCSPATTCSRRLAGTRSRPDPALSDLGRSVCPESSRCSTAGAASSDRTLGSPTVASEPVAFAQFGPLSAYPRAQHIRELYPQLPIAPPPSVITCVATTASARGMGTHGHSCSTCVPSWHIAASRPWRRTPT